MSTPSDVVGRADRQLKSLFVSLRGTIDDLERELIDTLDTIQDEMKSYGSRMKDDGYDRGYSEGYDQGKADAENEAKTA